MTDEEELSRAAFAFSLNPESISVLIQEIQRGFLLARPVTDGALPLVITSPEDELETFGLEVCPETGILLGRDSGRRRGSHDGGYVKAYGGKVWTGRKKRGGRRRDSLSDCM